MFKAFKMESITCVDCGSDIPTYGESEISCSFCGMQYERVDGSPEFGWLELIGAFIFGAFLLGPFIWTPLGREFTMEAIRRGAGVTRAKVEEWLRKGE